MMGGAPTHWFAALVALGVGLCCGALGAWLTRRRDEATGHPDDVVADVDEQLVACIAHLRDLEEHKHRLTPSGYQGEKDAYEARAAQLMRARRAPAAAPRRRRDEPLSPTIAYRARRPALRGALWGGGTVAVFALLYILVVQEERPTPQPPAAPPGGGAQANSPEATELRELMQELQQNPNDVPHLVRAAHVLLRVQMLDEAHKVNDRALQLAPDNLEAQVHAAVLRASQGEGDAANATLDQLLGKDPKLAEAWFFRGMLAMQAGNQARMKESFKQFVAVAPPGPQRDRIAQMMAAQGP